MDELPPLYLPSLLQFSPLQDEFNTHIVLNPGASFEQFSMHFDASHIAPPTLELWREWDAAVDLKALPAFDEAIPSISITDSMDHTDLVRMDASSTGFKINDGMQVQAMIDSKESTICRFNLPSGGTYEWRSQIHSRSLKQESFSVALTLYLTSSTMEQESRRNLFKKFVHKIHPGFISDYSSLIAVARWEGLINRELMEMKGILKPWGILFIQMTFHG
ncbi:hypothetical protein BCR33DRAFT_271660 [Rhizoclosmatium globosum]|uniref:Uncharacterized protein n=1 Tax=Rhizoclosmatium globosum TaxID=329046 RepID=A0A1Y2C9V6_9FUNG|nr:hypothetical protein BCR33DRAFT_271660 [Rhizoclosmatium globosum]|eukprot:ORY43105.1 hypothetical protein BCR33DRAFT_271660 [Rhizoclosmatium globosum]